MSSEIPLRIIQRVCIWFSMQLGDPPVQTVNKMRMVFGHRSYACASVFRLHKEYSSGHLKVGDKLRSGRPRSARTHRNVQVCSRAVSRDKCVDIHHLTKVLSTSYGTIFRILHHNLSLKKKASKYIPHVLTDQQKCTHVSFVVNFLDSYPCPRQLRWVVMTDESWFHVYDPHSKTKNMQ